MKKIISIIIVMVALVSTSCDKQNKAITYNPDNSKYNLKSHNRKDTSDSLQMNNIRLTCLFSGNNLHESAVEILSSRVLNSVSANGMGCIGCDPCFILLTNVTRLNESISSTVPTKYSVKYSLNFYIGNYISGQIFDSYSMEVMGIGDSQEKAEMAAMRSFKNSAGFRSTLYNASEKVKEYYKTDSIGFFNNVKLLVDGGKYAMAYSMLSNVPSDLGQIYRAAQSMLPDIYEKWLQQNSSNAIAQMKILSSDYSNYNPEIAVLYNSIPESSPFKDQARTILNDYTRKYEEYAKETIDHQRIVELERLAVDKLKAQLNVEANEELLNLYRNNYQLSQNQNSRPGLRLPIEAGPFSPLVEGAINSGLNILVNKFI